MNPILRITLIIIGGWVAVSFGFLAVWVTTVSIADHSKARHR